MPGERVFTDTYESLSDAFNFANAASQGCADVVPAALTLAILDTSWMHLNDYATMQVTSTDEDLIHLRATGSVPTDRILEIVIDSNRHVLKEVRKLRKLQPAGNLDALIEAQKVFERMGNVEAVKRNKMAIDQLTQADMNSWIETCYKYNEIAIEVD